MLQVKPERGNAVGQRIMKKDGGGSLCPWCFPQSSIICKKSGKMREIICIENYEECSMAIVKRTQVLGFKLYIVHTSHKYETEDIICDHYLMHPSSKPGCLLCYHQFSA